MKSKKTVIITIIIAAVFVVSGTVALAASNISNLEDLYLAFRTAQVNEAVEDGNMTTNEAETYLNNLTDRMDTDETDAVPPLRGGGRGFGMGAPRANAVELYSQISGLSIDEIRETCDGESSVYAIADEAGLLDQLKAAMIKDANLRIDILVEDGRITEEQAAEMKADSEESISSISAETVTPRMQGPRAGQGQGKRQGTGLCNGEYLVTP